MAYQSLYRRYRPGRFDQVIGQPHVTTALRNAVRDGRVGHAYLFSGPRGTGKTSTARILAKSLNCTDLGEDGEPCGACDSCLTFEAGTSYDLHELDAASNNGVEAVRDLISKVALASPGQTKVYVLDEVHMLTAGAENALLKTLEEPPDHVVFVLATTEPHKVVPTIRSRTQHYEFQLLGADELTDLTRWVARDAGLEVDESMVDHVVQVGAGSARDALSALDQVVAAGGVLRDDAGIAAMLDGLAAHDGGAVIAAVDELLRSGRDPRVIGEQVLGRLREAFLVTMGAPAGQLSDMQREAAELLGTKMGAATITRAMEVLGTALVDMRQAPDARIDLEVAMLRLTRPDLDADLAAIVARIEQLETGAPRPPRSDGAETTEGAATRGPADSARAVLDHKTEEPLTQQASKPTLGARRGSAVAAGSRPESSKPAPPPEDPGDDPPLLQSPEMAPTGKVLTVDAVAAALKDTMGAMSGKARSRFSGGHVAGVDGTTVRFSLPNSIHAERCEECRPEVEAALSGALGQPVELVLVVNDGPPVTTDAVSAPAASDPHEEEIIDVAELEDASTATPDGLQSLTDAFPGAELVDPGAE